MTVIKLETSATDPTALIGSVITENHFGVNFLSSYETADAINGGETYDDVLFALGGIDRDETGMGANGLISPIKSLRFPGGGLTEDFYKNQVNALSITAAVEGGGSEKATSPTEFLSLCKTFGASMTFVMPTLRYFNTQTHNTAVDAAEITSFILALLKDAHTKGVSVGAIELGNEWWAQGLTATEYGKIASAEAKIIQSAIDTFRVSLGGSGSNWEEPKILVQIGIRENDDAETAAILAEFSAGGEREAVDGFLTHRYVTTNFEEIADPWVQRSIYTFDSLGQYLSGTGWKPLSSMVSRVSEWNILQGSAASFTETGLKSYSTIVAMMAELASSGVDYADFWSVEDRTQFALTRHASGWSEGADFLGLSYTGEAFRMMNESLQGKTWLRLFEKTANNSEIHSAENNVLEFATGANLNTAIEAFSGNNEVVLFLSNRSGENDLVTLDLSTMVGANYHAWATKVSAPPGHETNQFSAPVITNFSGKNLAMANGVLSNISLDAWETLRVTITIGEHGAHVRGYTGNDDLTGSAYGDEIDGKGGDDKLFGDAGNDTIWGGAGNDDIGGGNNDQDLLYGGSGNDTIGGGTGNDTIYGGEGTDTAVFWGSTKITVDLRKIGAQSTGLGLDTLFEIENVQSGAGNDLVNGDNGSNDLYGNNGNDTIFGWAGSDDLYGGLGRDSILGGDGDDFLSGAFGNDTLFGGAGNDTLDGGGEADRLDGGSGNDLYLVNSTIDIVIERAGSGVDTVKSSISWVLGSHLENLQLIGATTINGSGNSQGNHLLGNSGANMLSGFDGNDTLVGGVGDDTLVGGSGSDTFVFSRADTGLDTVQDFALRTSGINPTDRIGIDGPSLGKFLYLGSGMFTGGSDNSEARVSGSRVLIDLDGDGRHDIQFLMQGLSNASELISDHFIFL